MFGFLGADLIDGVQFVLAPGPLVRLPVVVPGELDLARDDRSEDRLAKDSRYELMMYLDERVLVDVGQVPEHLAAGAAAAGV